MSSARRLVILYQPFCFEFEQAELGVLEKAHLYEALRRLKVTFNSELQTLNFRVGTLELQSITEHKVNFKV